MTGDNKGSDVGKEASGAAGKLLDGLLGVTPLGTIAFGVNEILKRTGNGDKLGDLKKKVTDGAGKLAADAAKPAASAAPPAQVTVSAPAAAGLSSASATAPAAPAAVTPPAASAVAAQGSSAHDVAYSDDQWASAAVHTSVAIGTALVGAKAAPPAPEGPKLPPKQVLTVPKGAKATDITKLLNENGLDRTQVGPNGPVIVNRKYYDISKEQKPLELADAMKAEFRTARDAPRDPNPTVAKAKIYDPVKPSSFEMDYT